MSLFKRVGDNIRANLNALLDKAEDPVHLLTQYLRDMEEDMVDAENGVARQLAVAKRFKAQHEDAAAMVKKRESQAMEALEKGREDLARKALEDKKLHLAKSEDYLAQFEKNQQVAENLKSQLRDMKDAYEQLKARKDSLLARIETAKAQKHIQALSVGIIGGAVKNDARRGFERMEEKVLQMESEVQVVEDLKNSGQSLDAELAALSNGDIERELAELKERLKKTTPSSD